MAIANGNLLSLSREIAGQGTVSFLYTRQGLRDTTPLMNKAAYRKGKAKRGINGLYLTIFPAI